MRVAPENIAFMCAVACIRTAEYARNCEASERFLPKMRDSNLSKPWAALEEYGEGKVSTTQNCDTMSMGKHHLFEIYANALNAMISIKVVSSQGFENSCQGASQPPRPPRGERKIKKRKKMKVSRDLATRGA